MFFTGPELNRSSNSPNFCGKSLYHVFMFLTGRRRMRSFKTLRSFANKWLFCIGRLRTLTSLFTVVSIIRFPAFQHSYFLFFFRKIRQKIFYRYIYSTKNNLVPVFYTCISANSMKNTMLNREEFIFTLLRNIFLQHFSQHSGNMCGTLVLEHLLLTVTGVSNL